MYRLSSRRARGWSVVVVVVALAVAVTGLGLRGDSRRAAAHPAAPRFDEIAGVPLLHGAHREHGLIAEGLQIPAGAVLLGGPMVVDHRGAAGWDHGWFATLLMVGEARQVVDDLDRQAARLGLARAPDGPEFPACRFIHRGHVRSCAAVWQGETSRLAVWLARGLIPGDHVPGEFDGLHTQVDRPISTVLLRLDHPVVGERPSEPPPTRPCEPRPNVRFSLVVHAGWAMPGGWLRPPGPGDRLGEGILPVGDDVPVALLRLPAGAQAVIAPSPGTGQALGYRATLAVTGDLDDAWTDLADQVRARVPEARERAATVGDTEIRTLWGSHPDGVCYSLEATTVRGRSWVEVSTSYDWTLELERRS